MASREHPQPNAPRLNDIMREGAKGEPITRAEIIIDRVRNGVDPLTAAGSADVLAPSFREWRRKGAAAILKQATPGQRITANDRLYRDFLYALEKAENEAEVTRLQIIARAAQGGYTTTTTTRKVRTLADNVQEVTEITVTTQHPGHWEAAAWWLERARRGRWQPSYILGLPSERTLAERAADLLQDLDVSLGRFLPAGELPAGTIIDVPESGHRNGD